MFHDQLSKVSCSLEFVGGLLMEWNVNFKQRAGEGRRVTGITMLNPTPKGETLPETLFRPWRGPTGRAGVSSLGFWLHALGYKKSFLYPLASCFTSLHFTPCSRLKLEVSSRNEMRNFRNRNNQLSVLSCKTSVSSQGFLVRTSDKTPAPTL